MLDSDLPSLSIMSMSQSRPNGTEVHRGGDAVDSGVSGLSEQFKRCAAFSQNTGVCASTDQCARDGMFAPTIANEQNLHTFSLPNCQAVNDASVPYFRLAQSPPQPLSCPMSSTYDRTNVEQPEGGAGCNACVA